MKVIKMESNITGRAILALPIPALSMAIISLLALSIERKYVVLKRKAREETIIRYCGIDNMAYLIMLEMGTTPFMMESILPKSSTAARMKANTNMATMATFNIEKMIYLSIIFILPS